MNIIDSFRLNILYRELKSLNIDEDSLQKMLSNKSFTSSYNNLIKPFIQYLKNYGNVTGKYIDFQVIINHLKSITEITSKNGINKYIQFIRSGNEYINDKISNSKVFDDKNFDSLYQQLYAKVFYDNIANIINNGFSDRLLSFINSGICNEIGNIDISIFEDRIWNVIMKKPTIGKVDVFNHFYQQRKINLMVSLIQNDLLYGYKFTVENIPESQGFIHLINSEPLEVFNMDFIKNIGIHELKDLYKMGVFESKKQYEKIFKIAEYGNYELIKDMVNYGHSLVASSFSDIPDELLGKSFLEIANITHRFSTKEVFLFKYLGVERSEIRYINLFLEAINKVDLPLEYSDKYGDPIELLNHIQEADEDEIIEISKSFSPEKKEEYQKLLKTCEEEGNVVLKNDFSKTIKIRSQEIKNNLPVQTVTSKNGYEIPVYRLEGQPFTMLVHSITNNKLSIHNQYVEEIRNNPATWENITNGNIHISTSLISNQQMGIYGDAKLIYGFDDISPEDIKLTDIADVGIDRDATDTVNYDMRGRGGKLTYINTVATVDHLIDKSREKYGYDSLNHTEIVISRKDENGNKRKPNYIVCINYITEDSMRAAEYFHIPIYYIDKSKYINPLTNQNNHANNNVDESEIGHKKR